MKTRKFNILDAILIVFVLAVIALFLLKFVGYGNIVKSGEYTNAEMVIEIKSIRDFAVNGIKESSVLLLDEDKEEFGEIVEKKVENATAKVKKANGDTVECEVPDRYDVYLKVKVEGVQKDDGFYLKGKNAVHIGNSKLYRSGYVVFSGEIISISVDK